MKTFQVLRLLTLAGITPFVAVAASAQDSYYYGGVGAGQSRGNLNAEGITADQGGGTPSDISRHSKDNAYKVFLGYQFNRYVGVELGYFHLGEFRFASTTSNGNLDGRVRVQGANVDVVGTLPFTENFSGLARIGAQVARTRDTFTGTAGLVSNNPSPSQREINPKIGVGLQYAFNPSLLVRTEVERYRIDDAAGHHPNVNTYTVSLVVPFGRTATVPKRAAAAELIYVESAPAPAPAVAVAPLPASTPIAAFAPPVVPQRVTFTSESLFGFDHAVLRPEGKASIDNFTQQLQGTTYDKITVEGHTDRLGTEAYNDKLSLQRAEVVKSYLVGSGKVDALKVEAVGKGEAAPVTKAEDCVGKGATPKLVSCLQPDRRVEIEVSGTR
jgi:OOP family OmpA-OmpF porin